jgi:hypothetical protein
MLQATRANAQDDVGQIRWPWLLVRVGLTVVALLLLWQIAQRMSALLAFPFPHDSLEGTLLYEARLLWSGEALYQPLELYRFVAAPYPPVHPVLLGMFDAIAGAHIFWGGRLLSLLAALGVALLIVLIVRFVAGSWLMGLLGAALLLSSGPALLWATRIKPDMLALFWTALGLWFAVSARPRAPDLAWGALLRSRLTLSAISLALAALTKQTALVAPLAVGLALLFGDVLALRAGAREGFVGRLPLRRPTLLFAAVYLAVLLGIWLSVDLITRGQLTFHVLIMHRRASWSQHLMMKFVVLLADYWPSMLLTLGMVALSVRQPRVLIPALYAVFVPFTLIGAGKTGANHNHLLETLLALSLGLGIVGSVATQFAAQLWRVGEWRRWGSVALQVVAVGLVVLQLQRAFEPQEWYHGELEPHDTPERFLEFIRHTPGEILADDVALLLMADKPLRYDDPTGMGPVAFSGVWDQSGLLDDIRNQRFSAIMLPLDIRPGVIDPSGHWTPEMLETVNQYYEIKFRDRINTYVPK